jgi:hypothetical protein
VTLTNRLEQLTQSQQLAVVGAAIVACLILLGIAFSAGNPTGGRTHTLSSVNSGAAYLAKSSCHSAVSDLLKSPSTAHFHSDTVAPGFQGDLEVTGQVDSENSFGATVTSAYSCETSSDGNTVIGAPALFG